MRSLTVLITGCSSGIGRALAQEFVRRGHVVYASARKPETLSDLAGPRLMPLALDVTSPASIAAALASIDAGDRPLDMLVNNAGYGLMGPSAELELDAVRRQLETNVLAPLALTQALVTRWAARRHGTIVNIGSISAEVTTPFSGAYCASKAALRAFSDALRMELKPFGITVVHVEPGGIASGFGAAALGASHADDKASSSLYANVADTIARRSGMSQQSPMSADQFARALVKKLEAPHPSARIRLGHGAVILPLANRLVPTRLFDAVLIRRFGVRPAGRES